MSGCWWQCPPPETSEEGQDGDQELSTGNEALLPGGQAVSEQLSPTRRTMGVPRENSHFTRESPHTASSGPWEIQEKDNSDLGIGTLMRP